MRPSTLGRVRRTRRTTRRTPASTFTRSRPLPPEAPREGQETNLAASAIADAQRILDRAARRLLAASLDGNSSLSSPREDHGAIDDGPDEVALLVEGEQIPVAARAHR